MGGVSSTQSADTRRQVSSVSRCRSAATPGPFHWDPSRSGARHRLVQKLDIMVRRADVWCLLGEGKPIGDGVCEGGVSSHRQRG